MLLPRYLRHGYKRLFLCSLRSGSINKCVWARNVESSTDEPNGLTDQTTNKNGVHANINESAEDEDYKSLHIPVMVREVIDCLSPQPGQFHILRCYNFSSLVELFHYIGTATFSMSSRTNGRWDMCFLDMTFGAGGHTVALLQKARDIKIYALDRDPAAYQIAQQLSDSYPNQIRPLLGKFTEAETLLISAGIEPRTLDGVLLDAGCSSMQLDTPERGFSLRKDGPLDMRMDNGRYPDMPTAADVVNALDQQALTSILRAYGEERHARKIASAIVQARSLYPITRTQQFASIVAGAFPAAALYARKDLLQRPTHVATKTFQALRIFVNDELHELYTGLRTAEKFLKPEGVLVALSFHSLEDRIIKRFLYGIDISEKPNLSIQQKIRLEKKNRFKPENNEEFSNRTSNSKWTSMKKKVITPQAMDIKENPRARSAKLRAATKL